MPSFPEYIERLMVFYHQQENAGSLSANVLRPTPAKLRRECLAVFGLRRSKTDLQILNDFFEFEQSEATYALKIKKYDIDKLKPLRNFLNGTVKKPEEKTVNLLAWLIDFQPRPYRFDEEFDVSADDLGEHEEEQGAEDKDNKHEDIKTLDPMDSEALTGKGGSNEQKIRVNYVKKYQKQGVMALAAIIIGSLGLSNNRVLDSINKAFNPQCMYWLNDHYIAIDCDQKIPNADIIPIDTFQLKHFKRITRWDKITRNDIGKVWYASVNGEIEFYTTSGHDPRQPNRQLRPMTKYIHDKYIQPAH